METKWNKIGKRQLSFMQGEQQHSTFNHIATLFHLTSLTDLQCWWTLAPTWCQCYWVQISCTLSSKSQNKKERRNERNIPRTARHAYNRHGNCTGSRQSGHIMPWLPCKDQEWERGDQLTRHWQNRALASAFTNTHKYNSILSITGVTCCAAQAPAAMW